MGGKEVQHVASCSPTEEAGSRGFGDRDEGAGASIWGPYTCLLSGSFFRGGINSPALLGLCTKNVSGEAGAPQAGDRSCELPRGT